MSLVFADEGLVRTLDLLTTAAGMSAIRIRLFQNNYTPIHASVIGSFVEANFSGYAEVTPSYGSATIAGDVATTTDSAPRDFTHNTGATTNDVYGYYVVDTATTKLLFAERFAALVPMDNNGDKITLTSLFSIESKY